MNWRDHAACLDAATDLFFPIGTADPSSLQVAEAKQVCAGCSVRDACLDWALKLPVDHGVWGGLSEQERRSLKRRQTRRRAPHLSAGPVVHRRVDAG